MINILGLIFDTCRMEILLYGLDSLLCFVQLVLDADSASWIVIYLMVPQSGSCLSIAFLRFDSDMPMLPMNTRFLTMPRLVLLDWSASGVTMVPRSWFGLVKDHCIVLGHAYVTEEN